MNQSTHQPDDAEQPSPDQQWLLHGDLPCLACGYNLRGLVGPVVLCPECGQANDLRDPRPWRTKKLPTGVLIREHWPASAALASLLVVVTVPYFVAVALRGPLAATLFLFVIVALVPTWWVRSCIRWLRSCQDRTWGWGVLVGTHLATWGILLGVTVPMAVTFESPWAWVGAILPVAGVAFFWLRAAIRRADRTGQFRADWRKWQLPTGPVAEQGEDAAER